MKDKARRIIGILEPLAAEHGLELVDVEVAGTRKNPILRVFLDTPEGGITLDDLAWAQSWVDASLEEADPFEGAWTLEVSSPGIDRLLRTPAHFSRFAGEEVVCLLAKGRTPSKVTGILRGFDDGCVLVETSPDAASADADRESPVDGPSAGAPDVVRIALDDICRAHIVGHIDFSGRTLEEEKTR